MSSLTDGLISYWRFNEGSNTEVVDSHGQNDLFVTHEDMWTTDSKLGTHAIEASSTTHRARGSNAVTNAIHSAISSGFTYSGWIKAELAGIPDFGPFLIIQQAGTSSTSPSETHLLYHLREDSSNYASGTVVLELSINGSAGRARIGWDSLNTIFNGADYVHVVVVTDTSVSGATNQLKLYLNGVLHTATPNVRNDDFGAGTTILNPTNAELNMFGTADTNAGREFMGFIDEVGLWDRQLTEAEISELYNQGDGLAYPFPGLPTVVTQDTTNKTPSSVTLNGELTDIAGLESVDVFFRYRKTVDSEWIETTPQTLSENSTFDANIMALDSSTNYTFKAVVQWDSGQEEEVSTVSSFTTLDAEQASITLISPQEGQEFAGTTVTFEWELETGHAGTVYLFVNAEVDAPIEEAEYSDAITTTTGVHPYSVEVQNVTTNPSQQSINTWFVRFVPD